jgi:hypothetical protein
MNGERRLIYHAALFFVVVFWFSSASAFQVCTTTGTGAEIKWGTTSTTYLVNTSGGPDNSLPAIQTAMQTWTDVTTSSFIFIYGGTTTSTAYGSNDGINIVTFGPMGTNGTLAENYFWYNSTTGEFKDTDIQFNTSYPWATDGSIIAYDVQNVGTHELGHSLCLDDLYDSADTEKTMYGYVDVGETKKRTLDQDDIDGITYLYPASLYFVAPNTGDPIPSGSSYPIQWEGDALSEAVKFKLLYSLNNGLTWRAINKNWPTNSYDWPVPTPWNNKKKCLLKVIGYDALGQKIGKGRSATFAIEVVNLTGPNGGPTTTYTSPDTPSITWTMNATKNPPVAKVKLFYTKNGGATWILIKTLKDPSYLTEGTHDYSWTVPVVKSPKYKCKVKVVLKDASGSTVGRDASDSYFTILPP